MFLNLNISIFNICIEYSQRWLKTVYHASLMARLIAYIESLPPSLFV